MASKIKMAASINRKMTTAATDREVWYTTENKLGLANFVFQGTWLMPNPNYTSCIKKWAYTMTDGTRKVSNKPSPMGMVKIRQYLRKAPPGYYVRKMVSSLNSSLPKYTQN